MAKKQKSPEEKKKKNLQQSKTSRCAAVKTSERLRLIEIAHTCFSTAMEGVLSGIANPTAVNHEFVVVLSNGQLQNGDECSWGKGHWNQLARISSGVVKKERFPRKVQN